MTSKPVSDIFNWYNLSKYRNIIYGFSAIWIIIFHIESYFPNVIKQFHPFIIELFKAGNVGVDIFLIMSGICLYFSLKKTNGKHILKFYQRRFSKLLKIYLFICIPWLIIWTIFKGENFEFFFNLATIFGKKGGQFWFIHFIAICYLIYPLLYRIIEKNKSRLIILFIPFYCILLCFLNINFKEFYANYEIAFTRLVPFLVGTLLAKRVYEKKPIKQKTVLIIFASLFLRDFLLNMLQRKQFLDINMTFSHLYFTLLALATIFLIILFFELFQLSKIQQFLNWTGKISLETYVMHIILIRTTVDILGFNVKNVSLMILFTLIIVPSSLLVSKLVQKALNHIPPRPPKRPVSSPASPPF